MTNPRSIGFIVAAKVAINPIHAKKTTNFFIISGEKEVSAKWYLFVCGGVGIGVIDYVVEGFYTDLDGTLGELWDIVALQ